MISRSDDQRLSPLLAPPRSTRQACVARPSAVMGGGGVGTEYLCTVGLSGFLTGQDRPTRVASISPVGGGDWGTYHGRRKPPCRANKHGAGLFSIGR